MEDASDHDKELLVSERDLVEALLHDRNPAMHRTSADIIRMLSSKSPQRSAKMMDYNIGSWLL
jgi:hypothetical protein